ncbi:alpha-glucosidase [Pseudovibrio sp. SCP19]|uniref:alpha-glucosidase n=1 Tax=Pseudovibrio sp. SCP19 TaxID=3141374 RepID=UPI0033381588
MNIVKQENGFTVLHKDRTVFTHSLDKPAIFLGSGQGTFDMYRGNFDIKDYVESRLPMRAFRIDEEGDKTSITLGAEGEDYLTLTIYETEEGRLKVDFNSLKDEVNRFWMRVHATPEEKVYGCGEQLTYFNLRGKNFPLWTSEPGVGRNKNNYVTWLADTKDKAGGDYYNTNYPQPTFVSNDKYFCHLQTTAYADFDFRHDDFHELQAWNIPDYLLFDREDSFTALVGNISDVFGTQPELPDWVLDGVILGIQGGTDITLEKIERARKAGVKVAGVWNQDWQGIKMTSFGKRLHWNWEWSPELYPGLDTKIHELKEDGVRFLGYINPYVLEGQSLYKIAKEKGYLATKADGGDYLVDFGEFYCGVVDFTNDEACEWYKGVIKENLIGFGLDGWMADFSEYLPTDCTLSNGRSAELEHNDWPRRWAKINHEAIEECGKTDDILFFMRAGGTGFQRYCHVLWAGDQCVDWCLEDGLASVIPGALSAGLMGNGIHHSDVGGYTTLHGMKRTKELMMRWIDFCAFTPMMRSHEGNRPGDNHQFDTDDETLFHLGRMSRVFASMKPYLKAEIAENTKAGIPVMRPLFMHYEQDETAYDIQFQYLLGRDVMVAPVYNKEETVWKLYLPEDDWVHAWSGQAFKGGWVTVDAPLGEPPVFYRKSSEYADLFAALPQVAKA